MLEKESKDVILALGGNRTFRETAGMMAGAAVITRGIYYLLNPGYYRQTRRYIEHSKYTNEDDIQSYTGFCGGILTAIGLYVTAPMLLENRQSRRSFLKKIAFASAGTAFVLWGNEVEKK